MNNIIMPRGMCGASANDSLIETVIRQIAESHSEKGEWADKYGVDFENDIFRMNKFCWCEKENCGLCEGTIPNFIHKPTGFTASWYKYIGRDMKYNKELTVEECMKIAEDCIKIKEGR